MAGLLSSPARAAWLAVLTAGCVYEDVDQSLQEAVVLSQGSLVVPVNSGARTADERVLTAFYENVLRQMQGAYVDRDPEALRSLLASYRTDTAPGWAAQQMDHFEDLALGLFFELHCEASAALKAPEELPALGEPAVFRLELPPVPGRAFRLGGEGSRDPFAFGVLFQIEDRDAVGGMRTQESNDLFRLPRGAELAADSPLVVPVQLAMDAGPAVVRRISVWVELLPGYVRSQGRRAPVRRLHLGHAEITVYPENVAAIRERPLATLREAMRRGDSEHFAHVYLAARFLPEDQREHGITLLMQWVRLGREDQARAAMAALRELTAADVPVGDREGWLRWWQQRGGGEGR